MTSPSDKSTKKRLKQLTAIAHGRELTAALKELRPSFGDWQDGEIDSFELNDRIHTFHQETSREIWKRYIPGTPSGMQVARALALGFLTEEEVGQELVEKLRPLVDCWKNDSEDCA
ncbi:MAG: hypothetical protein M8357_15655 [Desulfobulbaceae bacterium]|nr:hypothetical protein [Desulfobulbaceae bacterium]